jgi:hypothetical protein
MEQIVGKAKTAMSRERDDLKPDASDTVDRGE